MPDTLSKECRPQTGLEVQAALWRDAIQSLCNKELAAHQGCEVTLIEWAVGRSLLNIFVAILIPLPAAAAQHRRSRFGAVSISVILMQIPELESQHRSAKDFSASVAALARFIIAIISVSIFETLRATIQLQGHGSSAQTVFRSQSHWLFFNWRLTVTGSYLCDVLSGER
jgi:hypothetical protein